MIAGLDVSKNHVDVAIWGGDQRCRVSPEEAACWLRLRGVTRVVLEATGGYERPSIEALWKQGIEVARVNPERVRRFADALGRCAKTDMLDARMLAEYGYRMEPAALPVPQAGREHLKALHSRREELVGMRTQERNRLHTASIPVRRSVEEIIAVLNTQIAGIEKEMRSLLGEHPPLHAMHTLLTSMPGVGFLTAITLIAHLPELGNASREQIAALAGVAPYTRQSGRWKGKAICRGGRAPVRKALYMAAISAIRSHPYFKKRYQHLTTKAKPPKVALTAIIRHMLVTLNAMTHKNTPWKQINP